MRLRNILIAAIGLAVTAGAAGAASAATPWQTHHPRRVEVNHRLTNLNHAIRVDRRQGALTALQERRLQERTQMIRVQERNFASHNGGHLTRAEQLRLNHQENIVRHHIPS
jgi:hypothetical protein